MPNSWAGHVKRVPAALPSPAGPGGNSNPDRVKCPIHAAHAFVMEIIMSRSQSAVHHEPPPTDVTPPPRRARPPAVEATTRELS